MGAFKISSGGLAVVLAVALCAKAAPPDNNSSSPSTAPYQLPPVTVTGQAEGEKLKEEHPVGSYGQPEWTTQRRFPGVRTYVLPENTFALEYWTRVDIPRDGFSEVQHMFEAEIGLPYRFQLDLYGIARTEGGEDKTHFDQMIEVRWALADWGKIPWNPTLYVEYVNRDEKPDKIEAKLLLCDELAPRWHWAQNFLFEGETGGDREYEYGWTGGISYTLIDQVLSIGAEAQFSVFDTQGNRGAYRDETFVGPSIQYRPLPRMHLDFAPLLGVTPESPAAKLLFNMAYEF